VTILGITGNAATKAAEYINKNVENSSSVAVLRMTLITIINFIIVAAAVLMICFFTGKLAEGVIALLCSPLLRYFSGGVHLKSSTACNIVSIIMFLLAAHIQTSYYYTGLSLMIIIIFILLFYAPQGILNLSRLDVKYYPILKLISICIVASNFYFQSPLLSSVFFLQSLTLLPIAQKLVSYYKL
jgi:accessory gene regulator B